MTSLFTITMFVSAFLVFSLELMVGRMILPKFGGAPAVWNTAMLFFQAVLLAGYAYAHVVTSKLGVKRSTVIHLGIVVLSLVALPVAIPHDWAPPAGSNPVPWLLGYLLLAAGLPFLVVCTGAPLYQKWFVATGHVQGRDPYFLYAASNAGSLLGLISYPTVVETNLGLSQQSWFWSIGYGLLAVLSCCCAVAVLRAKPGVSPAPVEDNEGAADSRAAAVTIGTRLRWVTLAFVPSSLLLGVTTYLSTDISPIPLLWVIPLSIYLLTFIVAFGKLPSWVHRWLVWTLPIFIVLPLALPFIMPDASKSLIAAPAVHLMAFAAICLAFHGELARRRPAPARLTEFYLWVSFGGVLGGVFNALIAPVIFSTLIEYKLVLILAGLTMPTWSLCRPWLMGRRWEVARIATVVLLTGLLWWQCTDPIWRIGIPLMACALILTRPLTFGLGVGTIYGVAVTMFLVSRQHEFYHGRSFFGTLSVMGDDEGHYHVLYHGRTLHGAQWLDERYRRIPIAYFDPTGPAGSILASLNADRSGKPFERAAIIGLGAGTLAAYGRPGQEFTFFEIDPMVENMARTQFTYLSDSKATCKVVLGDGRLSLAQEPDKKFRLIVLDAFSSDAVPTHLLTREAIELYLSKLDDRGVIAVHISNRYLDLRPAVFAVAEANGLESRGWLDTAASPAALARGKKESHWITMVRPGQDLDGLKNDPRWVHFCRKKVSVWTDDYSNIFSALSF